jgi:hypothetical protein
MITMSGSKDLHRMSPEDIRNGNLLTLLLCCAKTLQAATPGCLPDSSPEQMDEANKQLASFVYQLARMYGDGHDLEADALALAKELGFEIEQRYLSKVAHA